MKKLVIGLVAHVDAGKTTLSEAMLYQSGKIRKIGRVDNKDAYLDSHVMEKERGITIFSKQALFSYADMDVTLLDTPGHVDFSTEMERALQVMDYALLIINGADGVQAHTRTLWQLLGRYEIPVFLFINKMDQTAYGKEKLLADMQKELSGTFADFGAPRKEIEENAAMCDEALMERYLEEGALEDKALADLIAKRKLFPCLFGSALKNEGVEALLCALNIYTEAIGYGADFGARVYKIMRDEQGQRLTFMKLTGGSLEVRDALGEEKISQIRRYSGEKFETVQRACAGEICAVTGLSHTYPGQGLGRETKEMQSLLEPVLTYRAVLPPEVDAAQMMPKFRLLEEEDPKLHITYEEVLKEIQVHIMGEVQLEILQRQIKDRFGILVEFTKGSVIYKETISAPALGVGHFEPLRHYAEVQLLLEPGEPGSGLVFASKCREDILAKNWQRLILTHLEEKEHKGVLTGSSITDIKITLVAGKAHPKHTEGGDFRQATYRAVRQGLMEAKSVLLEPYFGFVITVPEKMLGRAMTDMERMHGSFEMPDLRDGTAVLKGQAPVSAIQGYSKEVQSYTKGLGSVSLYLKGYYPCHNEEEVVEMKNYRPEEDLKNPTGSVFCAHGAGFVVPWDEVKDYKHMEVSVSLEGGLTVCYEDEDAQLDKRAERLRRDVKESRDTTIGTEEIERILDRTYHANRREEGTQKGYLKRSREAVTVPEKRVYKPAAKLEKYLLVDGYNVIFAWEELKEVAEASIDGARGKLLDILCDYQAMTGVQLIVVFDAYRVKGHDTEILDYHNIHVVFTKEAETADHYIEKFAHENKKKYDITVATSDGLEQIIIRGAGCALLSSRDLYEEVRRTKAEFQEKYMKEKP